MVKRALNRSIGAGGFLPDLSRIMGQYNSFIIRGLGALLALLILTAGSSLPEGEPYAALARQSTTDLTCVPYARLASGIELMGDAWSWWDRAKSRYRRGHQPIAGAILVLKRSERLYRGHLAVISHVVGPRQVLVNHANWVPGRIITNQPVIDVSPKNDWSMLRFYNLSFGVYGAVYPARGFIYGGTQAVKQTSVMPESPAFPAGDLEFLSWAASQ
jgi:surface antigen